MGRSQTHGGRWGDGEPQTGKSPPRAATTRSGREIWDGEVSVTTTKSSPTQKMHPPSHTKFVWRPAFYALSPHKKVPVGRTNSGMNIFPRICTQSEVGEYVRRAKVGKLEEKGATQWPPSPGGVLDLK